MLGKPFRSPLLVKRDSSATSDNHEPQAKKRRISGSDEIRKEGSRPHVAFKAPEIFSSPRRPLLTLNNPARTAGSAKPHSGGIEGYYNVLWSVPYLENSSDPKRFSQTDGCYRRKFTNKKHKTWDGDGILHVAGGYAHLNDISGRNMGKIAFDSPLLRG